MTISNELFRFVTARRPKRLAMHRINFRLIRDGRPATPASVLVQLFGRGEYETKLPIANTIAGSAAFLAADDAEVLAVEPLIDYLRGRIAPGVPLADLLDDISRLFPKVYALLDPRPDPGDLVATAKFIGRVWDSLYAQVIRGCNQYLTTNYLADCLKAFQVLRILWFSRRRGLTAWRGGRFDEYEVLIDTRKAQSVNAGNGHAPGEPQDQLPEKFRQLQKVTRDLVELEDARQLVQTYVRAGAVRVVPSNGTPDAFLDAEAIQALKASPALAKVNIAETPINTILRDLDKRTQIGAASRQRLTLPGIAERARTQFQTAAGQLIARDRPDAKPSSSIEKLSSSGAQFGVALDVGQIRPPLVGDLVLVEQELRGYEPGELAYIEPIMRGERREQTTRALTRTSQTTTTETTSEREETQSLKTDERFQLSTEAERAASQTFSVEAGVNVTGKFGPVQVGASVNASFSTSKSLSESTSQEFARTVTEEASTRIRETTKQSSSITFLSETQKTTLQGFNNERSTTNVNGLYRWVDKIYTASLLNYGRRLMLDLVVPEPAAFYRGLLSQDQAAVMLGLEAPIHPSRISVTRMEPLEESAGGGFDSYKDITEYNYASLAAMYDVVVEPPPPLLITGTKAIVYPEAMQAGKVSDNGELTYVAVDNSLTLDPDYRLIEIGVFAPVGENGGYRPYANVLKLGENKDVTDHVLVQVANKSFYFSATGHGNDPKDIDTNFNAMQLFEDGFLFSGAVQPAVPITLSTTFEGVLTLTVAYEAIRRDETLDRWKAEMFAAIIQGYDRKKQAYDQAIQIAQSKANAVVEARTYQLRDEQYRSIELTEIKRGCVELLTAGTAAGFTSLVFNEDGSTRIVFDQAEGSLIEHWRPPLANGAIAQFFEEAFDWSQTTYRFYPYFWTDATRWRELQSITAADPVFEQFLKAGSAGTIVPVKPGYERPVLLFLKIGRPWVGGYLPLFTADDILEVYADVELGVQLDPPEQMGEPWDIRLPTTMVMLQEDEVLPTFPPEGPIAIPPPAEEPALDESVPF